MTKLKECHLELQERYIYSWGIICPPHQREIKPGHLPSVRFIGQGISGIIYETTLHEKLGQKYARKDFPGAKVYVFQLDVDALCGLTHENLVECVGVSFGYRCCSLVLEYVVDDLHNVMQKRKFNGMTPPFKKFEWIDILSQIANAIKYLHEHGVAHGDLKPNNVLISISTTGQIVVKVVDFGLIETKQTIRLVTKRFWQLEILRWKAPELVHNLLGSSSEDLDGPSWRYDDDSDEDDSPDSDIDSCSEPDSSDFPDYCESSESKHAPHIMGDIYSFGMVCYEILTGDMPFSNQCSLSALKKTVLTGDLREILKLPEDCPSELKTLIENCWNKKPSHRPSFREICVKLDMLKNEALPGSITSAVEMLREGDAVVSKHIEPGTNVLSGSEGQEAYQEPKGGPASEDVGTSKQLRERCSDAKHMIFLSHSGAQQDFVEGLCMELEIQMCFPFLVKRPVCWPRDKEFHRVIKEAAKRCQVAVFVLSEEFFTRGLSMIELTEFVKAQESTNMQLKILPVFLGITMEELKDRKRLAHWVQVWQDMACKDGWVDVKEWEDVVSKVCGMNGVDRNSVDEEHVGFTKQVATLVCKLIPPILKWDMSFLQSVDRLLEPILQKLKDVEVSREYGVSIVGLYGMGGVGKTSISKVVCNQMVRDFGGKICHVELGGINLVESRKKVLQELTEANSTILSDSLDELADLLKKRMCWHKVFLVLDNVGEQQIEEALMYLTTGYHNDSVVLVVSRTLDTLQQLHIGTCLEMPELEEEAAINLFLQHAGLSSDACLSENDREIVKRCVRQCSFPKLESKPRSSYRLEHTSHYLPLALKVLGSQFGRISHDVSMWTKSLERLEADMPMEHPVFSVLRLGYDALQAEEQIMFMDLALILVPEAGTHLGQKFRRVDVWKWLCTVHRKTQVEIRESVNALWRKGLLEKGSEIDEWEIIIHDLFLEFAKGESLREFRSIEGRRFLVIDKDGPDVPHELLDCSPGSWCLSLRRLIIHNSEMRSVNLSSFLNVEVLQFRHCKELEEVDVTGMRGLRYMEVTRCDKLVQRIEGVEKLSNLVWLRWITDYSNRHRVPKFIYDLTSLTALDVLQLEGFVWSNVGPNLPLNKLPSLSNIDFSNCSNLIEVHLSSPFTSLQELNLNFCEGLTRLPDLHGLILLRRLNVGHTEISSLPDLGKLEQLVFLDVSSCKKLTSLVCITHALTLRHVDASRCENLRELPDHVGGLERLEMVDLSWDVLISTLPNGYERLVKCDVLKVEGCWGLVVPLVIELQREVSERSLGICTNSVGCVSRSDKSMQSWTDGRMAGSPAAYDLLKHVFPDNSCRWSYLLDDEERDGFLIRALCEHYYRGGTLRLSSAIAEVIDVDYEVSQWWAVVATAPCTFGFATERARLEPYQMTLLHYTIVRILPEFLVHGNLAIRKHEAGVWPGTRAKLGIEVVLRKCKEQLREGKREYCSYPVYSEEVRETVDTFLSEIEKLESDHATDPIQADDLLKVAADPPAVGNSIHGNIETAGRLDVLGIKSLRRSSILRLTYDNGPRYNDTFPNFPFGPLLATQCFSWYQSFAKDVPWL